MAGLSGGRVVEAVLDVAAGRVVVVDERVVLAPGANVVVVVLPVDVGVVARRVVVEARATSGLRS